MIGVIDFLFDFIDAYAHADGDKAGVSVTAVIEWLLGYPAVVQGGLPANPQQHTARYAGRNTTIVTSRTN